MIPSRWFYIGLHVIGWLAFLSLPLLFVNRGNEGEDMLATLLSPAFWLFVLFYVLVFYIHFYLLIPRYLFTRRYTVYGLSLGVGLLLTIWLQPFDRLVIQKMRAEQGMVPPFRPDRPPPEPMPPRQQPTLDIVSVVLFLMVWALGLALRITQRLYQTERRMVQAEADKVQAELSSLKAQINPHFLFNTLNTIYTMARLNHPACAESIMKLSNIMRYVSDEVAEDYVPLQDELDCMGQYIDLQRLRLNKKTTIRFDRVGDITQQRIPPLVLMTFVENIFKHGVSSHQPSVIDISVVAENDQIGFYSRNRKFQPASPEERSGTGLNNVRKRLQHLYPGSHTLHIGEEGDYFIVNLVIQK